jgi:hypothetical protein
MLGELAEDVSDVARLARRGYRVDAGWFFVHGRFVMGGADGFRV